MDEDLRGIFDRILTLLRGDMDGTEKAQKMQTETGLCQRNRSGRRPVGQEAEGIAAFCRSSIRRLLT